MIKDIINKIFQGHKGILAADESNKTIIKRLTALSVDGSEENITKYRNTLFGTNNLNNFISGIILYKDTLEKQQINGLKVPEFLMSKNIIPGIKVDGGLENFNDSDTESYTKGLAELKENCENYYKLGARFSKWRSVFFISTENSSPTDELIEKNTDDLASYAKISQEAGLVPFIEPEILRDGEHSIEETKEVFNRVFKSLFEKLTEKDVDFESLILKTSFVVSGSMLPEDDTKIVQKETVEIFKKYIPEKMGGIVFLSGGLTPEQSFSYLHAVIEESEKESFLIPISFSYSRALQNNAMLHWSKNTDDVITTQEVFSKDLKKASDALQ